MSKTELAVISRMRAMAAEGKARAMREAADISLREFAAALGTSPSSLSRWETGECRPQSSRALLWAELLEDLTGQPV